jgi:hypothetical protein
MAAWSAATAASRSRRAAAASPAGPELGEQLLELALRHQRRRVVRQDEGGVEAALQRLLQVLLGRRGVAELQVDAAELASRLEVARVVAHRVAQVDLRRPRVPPPHRGARRGMGLHRAPLELRRLGGGRGDRRGGAAGERGEDDGELGKGSHGTLLSSPRAWPAAAWFNR